MDGVCVGAKAAFTGVCPLPGRVSPGGWSYIASLVLQHQQIQKSQLEHR